MDHNKLFIIFFVSFSIFFAVLVVMLFRFDKDEIHIYLDSNEYEEIEHVKIYNALKFLNNTELMHEINSLDKELLYLLGSIEKTDLSIIIFRDLEEMMEYGGLKNAGAFYQEDLQVIGLVQPSSENFYKEKIILSSLRHEYTHYYMTEYIRQNQLANIPKWFSEGLADYVAFTLKGTKAKQPNGRLIDFRLLQGRIVWSTFREHTDKAYIQSHYAVEYVVKNYGESTIKRVIDDSSQLGFSKSFKKHTGIEIKNLHKLINNQVKEYDGLVELTKNY